MIEKGRRKFMKHYLLPEAGRYFKAAMHVHTTISDGQLSPEETKQIYQSAGYSVVAITDHQIMLPHPELNDESFLTITGVEVAKNKGSYSLEPSTHYNVYAKDPTASTYPFFDPDSFWEAILHAKEYLTEEARVFQAQPYEYAPEDLNRVIAACNAEGYLVCYNHPVNSLQNYTYYGKLRGLWGIECANGSIAYPETITASDDLWRKGERRAFPIASDDTHRRDQCDHGYIMVKAEKLEYSTVFTALERGDFYASTGITIHDLYIEDGVLHLNTDGVDEIKLITPVRYRKAERSHDTPITDWSCDIAPILRMYRNNYDSGLTKDMYIRLELRRKDGAVAYTKAYFLDDFPSQMISDAVISK